MAHTCYKELGLRYHDLYWTETLIDAAERRPWVRFSLSQMAFSICVQNSSVLSGIKHSQYFRLTLDWCWTPLLSFFFFRETGKGGHSLVLLHLKGSFFCEDMPCTYERCHP